MRGLKYAASAKHLLRPSVFEGADEDEKRMLLVSLATGVLYHSKLRTIHVWQILQTILPEFEPSFVKDEKTCSSPWSVACPPKLAKRSSGGSVPPQFTLATAETFCNEQVEEALEGVCGGDAESGDVSDSVALPSSAPDGQYGYHEITPRDASDPLAVAFEYLDSVTIPKSQLDDLEAKLKGLHNRSKDLNRKIDQLWKTVGGREQDRMGPNGELFGISNECFVVEAGKYEYELCIFGKAYQRDRGGASKSGTSLGSWRKMEVDEESGNRIFRWEGGAKCWNGPERSATAVVTCGAETRVLSADEPETCAYGMQMESHIACDDTFRKQNEIPLP
uniref:MRH domain-containing protein n=1 Tax=Craspedostauros australis TaxID=1486917 RepID=A0A7R9ZQQ2_9STRA|eukprot:CAMPEP_0198132198 /NCGR_PEP_ID=MMETSP1442-20131203/57793_1 /TAXON_ID= /ORGANISM="Craspedostauros australis, Strain CCMP3328" /LENGTH=333 /DNA_ID=CAMNT_0043793143 /DNA_START=21 /DNA_END=1022 /DNA_ORIENTATION=-